VKRQQRKGTHGGLPNRYFLAWREERKRQFRQKKKSGEGKERKQGVKGSDLEALSRGREEEGPFIFSDA